MATLGTIKIELTITPIESEFYQKQKEIAACKKALSIISRFKPSEYRGKHISKIFTNLNIKKGELARMRKGV